MPVVTIARQLGSGGEEIAARVGDLLGARVLDGDLLVLASARSGIPVGHLADLDERGRSLLRQPLDLVRRVPLPTNNPALPDAMGDRYPPTGPIEARGEGITSPVYWAIEAYAALMAHTVGTEAAGGNVVIVGRAGNEALAGAPGVLNVLTIAGEATRVERLASAERLEARRALERVRDSDQRRAAYVRQFFRADWLDARRYDLVVNTDRISFEAAAQAISGLARTQESAPTPEARRTAVA